MQPRTARPAACVETGPAVDARPRMLTCRRLRASRYRSRTFSSGPPSIRRIACSTTNASESACSARTEPRVSCWASVSVAVALKRSSCAHRRRADGAERVSRATVCTSVTGSFAPLRARARRCVRAMQCAGACEARARRVRGTRAQPHLDGPLANHLLATGLVVARRRGRLQGRSHARLERQRRVLQAKVALDRAAPAAPVAHCAPPSCSLEPGPMPLGSWKSDRKSTVADLVIETPTILGWQLFAPTVVSRRDVAVVKQSSGVRPVVCDGS